MRLIDIDTGDSYSLPDLFRDWNLYRKEEPWNHADTFRAELYTVIMDTINGRNNCDVVGFMPDELERFMFRLYSMITREERK